MYADDLISTINNMTMNQRVKFGEALAKCGVAVSTKESVTGKGFPTGPFGLSGVSPSGTVKVDHSKTQYEGFETFSTKVNDRYEQDFEYPADKVAEPLPLKKPPFDPEI